MDRWNGCFMHKLVVRFYCISEILRKDFYCYYIFRISSSVLWSIERHVQYRFVPGPVYGLLRVILYDVIKEFYKGLQA